VAESVPPLRRALRRFARRRGAAPVVQARVALAFSEVCVLLLGPGEEPGGDPGLLIVEARGEAGELRVRVSDSRRGLRPLIGPERRGFELALMTQACDRVSIDHRREGHGMTVTMTFALAGDGRPSTPPRTIRTVTAR
jgi:anti-sigma regulatory factor (Ser/Thr protein kinase)